jgi:hypothetical protein
VQPWEAAGTTVASRDGRESSWATPQISSTLYCAGGSGGPVLGR